MEALEGTPARSRRLNTNRRNALRSLRRRDVVSLLLVGGCHVGKTALAMKWVNNTFADSYVPTVEDFHMKGYRYMGQSVSVGLIDLSGCGHFPAMFDLYVSKTDSIMYVYEVGNAESVRELRKIHEKIVKVRGECHGVVQSVVGTKIDQVPDTGGEGYNSVEVDELLVELGHPKHIVTSAKLDMNVADAFENALSGVVANMIPDAEAIKRFSKMMKKSDQKKKHWFKMCCS